MNACLADIHRDIVCTEGSENVTTNIFKKNQKKGRSKSGQLKNFNYFNYCNTTVLVLEYPF